MAQKQVRSTRPSARVFRRRRLAVLIATLVLLGLLAWAGFGMASLLRPADPGAAPAASQEGGSSPQASVEPTEESSAGPAVCPEGDVLVTASTAQATHGPADNPVLVMTIKNAGTTECMVNVGTSQQEFSVTSGSDRIFSTSDCVQDPMDTEITIKPGSSETARFTWTRVRSAPGCKIVSAKPRPGWYGFTAKLGDLGSETAKFELK
ncbi:hypothetical protein DQ353_11595 [Arthrobacter sp. AQ5-05]|uniref:hypothetical protein n=1 Tax=Arthrobacter sp. AQ5-05 TaxID=2184581 RepID=UPI000DCB539D|nr:hypothetical protein [Arthrobacter sp. AQ5-05]RAX49199.1 hypothetical protein DQ353_11595 [Arthrobacter sp. AQ5-05]